jgi:hypothetical protein
MSSVLLGCGGSGHSSVGDPTGWVDRCPICPSYPDARCTGPTSTNLAPYTGSASGLQGEPEASSRALRLTTVGETLLPFARRMVAQRR